MNALIVDDEPLARARLKRLLSQSHTSIQVQGEAGNGNEALIKIKKLQPDLVFLDVDMPGLNGIEVANQLNSFAVPPAIIFITAHPEHALDALQLNAAGYLVKPISVKSLQHALQQLGRLNRVHLQQQQAEKVTYQLAGTIRSVEIESIFYFNAEEKYTKVVFDQGEALIEDSLKHLEMQYPHHLLRIHRHTLVNKNKIIALHTLQNHQHVIELDGCTALLAVSRRALKSVKSEL